MEYEIYYHNHADSIINSKKEFAAPFYDMLDAVAEATFEENLIHTHIEVQQKRPKVKSLSEAINILLKRTLINRGFISEPGIFKEPPYDDKNNKKWRLDFARDTLSIEVAFNHGEAIAHNLWKPILASQLNHVKKAIQTQMAVIITATKELKDKGNFDNAVGTYDKYIEYLKPYAIYMSIPVVIIGLKAPETFIIDKGSREIIKIKDRGNWEL